MSEWLADSPSIAEPWCPGCRPDADQFAKVLDVRWCDDHVPVRDGSQDEDARVGGFLSGTAEAGGTDNQRFCDFIHRKEEPQ